MKKLLLLMVVLLLSSNQSNAKGSCSDVTPVDGSLAKGFTVSLSVGIKLVKISVSTEVCCWRKTVRSPKYDCCWGNGCATATAGNSTGSNKGYINLENFDKKTLAEIEKDNLRKIKIENSSASEDGLKVADGEYEILNDGEGRYLVVNIVSK